MNRIPEIQGRRPLDLEQLAVGQHLFVAVYGTTDSGAEVARPVHELVSEVTRDVLGRLGIQDDRSLATLCGVIAQASIGKLVTGDGFEVRHGGFDNYRERVSVDLRPPQVARAAEVTRETGEQ